MNGYAILLTVIGVLTVLCNLIVEVVKPLTAKYIPTELTAVIVAELLTLAGFFGWADHTAHPVTWYLCIAAIVLGLLVSYAAQFGFDKLKAALEGYK